MRKTIEELEIGTPNENGANEEGFIIDFEIPTTREVCPRCGGDGKIVNPSIGAITGEEWDRDWDEDSREGYFAGRYDVTCPECDGRNVVDVPNPEAIENPVVREAVERVLEFDAQYAAECAYERKMGY